MKKIYPVLLTASAALLMACSGADTDTVDTAPEISTAKAAETAPKPAEPSSAIGGSDYAASDVRTKAVLVYADWCGSCKILEPKLKMVRTALGEHNKMPGLEFVTIDYTDKNKEDLFAQADAVGVGKAVRNYLGGTVSTGVLLLVDLDDERVVGTVTKDFGNLEIKSALKDAVSSS